MRLTKKQEVAVKNGQRVLLRKEGVDYVVIRADLYDRVATMFEFDNPRAQSRSRSPDVVRAVRNKPNGPAGNPSEPWSEEKNDRRCELIDKDIEGSITESEILELERLQLGFYEYLDSVAPPPMEGARRLHRKLLDKKRQRKR